MTATKNQMSAKINEQISLLSAAILGVGAGLIISIVFTKLGVWLILAGLAVKAFGTLLVPYIVKRFKYRPVTCPFCRQTSEVRKNYTHFACDSCGRLLTTENDKVKPYTHLRLVVNNKSSSYGKPVANNPVH